MSTVFLGVDLAWRHDGPVVNETGVAAIDASGHVLDAGWTHGLDETIDWIQSASSGRPAVLFVDAPLVVTNPSGQRPCEREVGQRYGRWLVSANSTNIASPRLAGVELRRKLEASGWTYSDGTEWPSAHDRTMYECYPYTTLVGAAEFKYDQARPTYKRKPKHLRVAEWRPIRDAACEDLIRRLTSLANADPPLRLDSHDVTRALGNKAPVTDKQYKHREDLIDALICAWTASLWARHGQARCQVLGADSPGDRPAATIIAPARPEQRQARQGLRHGSNALRE